MFIDLPVDLIKNHPFGRPPTREDFLAAEAKPVREWIQESFWSLELSNPASIIELRAFMMCSGTDRLVTFAELFRQHIFDERLHCRLTRPTW